MLCPVGGVQHLYIYLVRRSIFIWFVKPHAHFEQRFISGVYSSITSECQPGKIFALEQREKAATYSLCSDNCALDVPVSEVSPLLLGHTRDRLTQPASAGAVSQGDSTLVPGYTLTH